VKGPRTIWAILGIAPTDDEREIRRAYAKQLKLHQPEDDPEGFQRLRAAYEAAIERNVGGNRHAPAPAMQLEQEQEPEPAPPPVADEELVAAGGLVRQFAREVLGGPLTDPQKEIMALRMLLAAPPFQRLDLHQSMEQFIAELLAEHSPRTDHLLQTAVNHFDWDSADIGQRDSSGAAHWIRQRLADIEYHQHLLQQGGKELASFQRLMKPMPGWRRWVHAVWQTSFPDFGLLQRLRVEHPTLFGQLPRETVEWWDDFARRPQPSRLLLTCLFYGTVVVAGISILKASDEPDWLLPVLGWALFPIVGPVLAVLFKLYVIDWPALLVYRRWGSRFAPWVLLGWFPLGILNIFAATWAHVAGAPTWPFALAGFLLVLWSIYISGPVQTLHYAKENTDHRDVRVVFLNAIVVVWFWTMESEPMNYDAPIISALVLPLVAGSYARPVQMGFFHQFAERTRKVALWIGLFAVLGFFALVHEYARFDAAKPWLVAGILTLILFRRTLPHGLLYFEYEWFGRILLIIGLVVSSSLATSVPFTMDSSRYNPPVTGMLLYLFGAALVIFAEFHAMRRIKRPPRNEHGEV
jgi:hypothetical protein